MIEFTEHIASAAWVGFLGFDNDQAFHMIAFPGALRVFHEVVRAGSVRAASDALGLSPSSVTRQIQQLEHQIGAVLLERTRSGVSVTHAGRLVSNFAQSVVMEYDTLQADINERRGLRGHIRVAAVESTVGKIVSAISAFREALDGVTFTVSMFPAGRVIEAVRNAEVDVGVTFCSTPDLDLTVLNRLVEPIVLAVNPNHEWAFHPSVSLSDLVHVPFGIPDPTFGVRAVVDEAARAAGINLAPVLVSNSFEALRAFARSGGVSILPRMSFEAEYRANLLKMVPFGSEALNLTTADIIVLKGRRPSRLLRLFYRQLEQMS